MFLIRPVSIALYLLFISGCTLAPGSYPYAECYDLSYTEAEVKAAIRELKCQNPDFVVPKMSLESNGMWDLPDGPSDDRALWYMFYFYLKNENSILLTWTRSTWCNSTTFALVRVKNGTDIGNWKTINLDLNSAENSRIIKVFENEILAKVEAILKSKKK